MFGYYNYGMGSSYDWTILLVFIGMIVVSYAQYRVKSTFNKYSDLPTEQNITGKQAAEFILQKANISDVTVEPIRGELTDHYDPRGKVLRLSEATYNKTSVSAVAVAAHECGHAIQDAQNYNFMRIRAALVPVVNIGSSIAMPLILMGFILDMAGLITAGIIAFSLVLLFQIVTLPVEFDASRRAIAVLDQSHIFAPEEVQPARKVLNAAAFTYVAATLSTTLQLVRFLLLSRQRDRR